MKRIIGFLVTGMFLTSVLTGCGDNAEPDDYVTNIGYEVAVEDTAAVESTSGTESDASKHISKEDIKVGV